MMKVVVNPYKDINFNAVSNYKGDFHVHSYPHNDGLPHELIDRYNDDFEFDILALTCHDIPTFGFNSPMTNWKWTELDEVEVRDRDSGEFDEDTSFEDAESRNPDELDIMAVEGIELTNSDHRNSLFNDLWESVERYDNEDASDIQWTLEEVANRFGLSFICHPDRYSRTDEYYADLYKSLPTCFGMEVWSDTEDSREIWDSVLTELMPYRPVWGMSNSDNHNLHSGGRGAGRNWNTFFMEKLNYYALRRSFSKGEFFFSFHENAHREPDKHVPKTIAPEIEDVLVTVEKIELTINKDYDNIKWISEGEEVETGNIVMLENENLGSYVRAVVEGNDGGLVYTQPFGLIDTDAELNISRITKKSFASRFRRF